jgi:hypothetical protein
MSPTGVTKVYLESSIFLRKIVVKLILFYISIAKVQHLVAVSDQRLIGFKWEKIVYTECCLPLGLSTAPFLFNLFAEALHWVLEHRLHLIIITKNQSARSVSIRNQLMLLRLTKIQRKTIGIYVPILLRDLGCRPGGGSQKQVIDASRAVPVTGNSKVNPDSERIPTRRTTTKITVWPEGRTGVQAYRA